MKTLSLIAIGFCLLSCRWGYGSEPQTDQEGAIAKIKLRGGKVICDEEDPTRPVIGVNLDDVPGADAEVRA